VQAAISADAPVAATVALLALRRTCLQTSSPDCLAAVDQDDSPMLDADRSFISAAHAGETHRGEVHAVETYVGFEASLIQRSGGSALIALAPSASAGTSKPASALVIEGESGWRLREVFQD
jgi:hypothetical protein